MENKGHYPPKKKGLEASWICPECMRLVGVTLCDPPSYVRRLRRMEKNFFSRILALFILLPLSFFATVFFVQQSDTRILPATSSSTIRQQNPADSEELLDSLHEDLLKEPEEQDLSEEPPAKVSV